MSTNRTIQTNALDGVQSIPNYIGNGKATYATTAGFAVYADAAGTNPVDGTGGAANVTMSTSSSLPLSLDNSFLLVKDAANRQGQGWSYDFTIQSCDQAKVLQLQLDYLISSGTFAAGSSSTDSDVTLWLYDITNAVLIQPSTFRLYSNSSTISSSVVSNFQTASNSTSYRLIMHIGSTSASAYTLKVDNISVSPTQYVYGTPITDWAAYTPIFTGFGTVTSIEMQYRRVGSDLAVRGKFTPGTTTATEARMSLPTGMTSSDINIIPSIQQCGVWVKNLATTEHGGVSLIEPSVTYVTFSGGSVFSSTSVNPMTKQPGDNIGTNNTAISLTAVLPIQGFSSSVQMSDSADTRVVAASYYASANGTTSTTQTVNFDTKIFDTHGAVTAAAAGTGVWKFTAPVSGYYTIRGHLYVVSGTSHSMLYKNGTSYTDLGNMDSTSAQSILSYTIQLIAGDYIDLRTSNSQTYNGGTLSTINSASTICIEKLSGPSAIAATETVVALLTSTSTATVSSTDVKIAFNTKVLDSHNAFDAVTNNRYTVPAAGPYQFTGVLNYGSAGAALTAKTILYKNGVAYRTVLLGVPSGPSFGVPFAFADNSIAGDYYEIFGFNGTGTALVSGSSLNINRIK